MFPFTEAPMGLIRHDTRFICFYVSLSNFVICLCVSNKRFLLFITVRQPSPPSLHRATKLHAPTTNVSDFASSLRFFACCICIPDYSCEKGHVSISRLDVDDFSLNYATCPNKGDTCCPVDEAPMSCQLNSSDVFKKPNSVKRSINLKTQITGECECLPIELCPPDLVIKHSPDDYRYELDSCSDSREVCCSLSDLPLNSTSESSALVADLLLDETSLIEGIPSLTNLPNFTSKSENVTVLPIKDDCICVEEHVCDVILHLMGISRSDYLSYVDTTSKVSKRECKESQVCCALPASLATSDDSLLFQTPAATYASGDVCYGYFHSDQLPVSISEIKYITQNRYSSKSTNDRAMKQKPIDR